MFIYLLTWTKVRSLEFVIEELYLVQTCGKCWTVFVTRKNPNQYKLLSIKTF